MFEYEHLRRLLAGFACILLMGCFLLLSGASGAAAFDADEAFRPMTKVISGEGSLVHFSSGRLAGGYINAWNVGARVSVLPFGVIHSSRVLHGTLDGAFEVGLEPTFERFNTVHQNFAGVLLELRYHFIRLSYGPFVPWIGASIGPGYSDLSVGRVHDDNKLKGPFLALIKGEVGVACFIDSQTAAYMGLQAQHLSNGGLNGSEDGLTTNASLNTPWGMVIGVSWFFH
jgi:hypothetical protein